MKTPSSGTSLISTYSFFRVLAGSGWALIWDWVGVGGRWGGVGVGAYSRLGAYSNKYGTQITVRLLACSMKILRVLIFANFADWPRSAKISSRRKKTPQNKTPQKLTPFSKMKNSAFKGLVVYGRGRLLFCFAVAQSLWFSIKYVSRVNFDSTYRKIKIENTMLRFLPLKYCWFSHDVTKIQTKKLYRSYRDFTFTMH